jgi:hypothetical protein
MPPHGGRPLHPIQLCKPEWQTQLNLSAHMGMRRDEQVREFGSREGQEPRAVAVAVTRSIRQRARRISTWLMEPGHSPSPR